MFRAWLERTEWLWLIIGGFYLVAYLYWYIPALWALPGSVRDPPARFPWHWPLDFLATGLAGAYSCTSASVGRQTLLLERRRRPEPGTVAPAPPRFRRT